MSAKIVKALTGAGKGEMVLDLIEENGTKHPFRLSPKAAEEIFAFLLYSANSFPPAAEGQSTQIQMEIGFAVADPMQPAFLLKRAQMQLGLPIGEKELAYLHDQIGQYLRSLSGRPH